MLIYTYNFLETVAIIFSELVIENMYIVHYHPKTVAYFMFSAYTGLLTASLRIATILIHLIQSFQN